MIDLVVSNILVGSNCNQKLLYHEQNINPELDSNELLQYNIYKNVSIDEKIKKIIEYYIDNHIKKTKNFYKKSNVSHELIVTINNDIIEPNIENNNNIESEESLYDEYYNNKNLKYLAKKYIELD
jgi:hypothetical protein